MFFQGMKTSTERPVLIYDESCPFCRRWADCLRTVTCTAIEFVSAEEGGARFPEIGRERMARAVQLVRPCRRVERGAEAVYTALAYGGHRWLLWLYRRWPGFAITSELAYWFLARHRREAGVIDCRLFGSGDGTHLDVERWRFFQGAAISLAVACGLAILVR